MLNKHKKKLIGLAAFLVFASWVYYTSVVRITKNFDVVDDGKFYRSAQLSESELEETIKKYGIKQVISLRGLPKNSYWTPGEIAVTEKMGVKLTALGWMTDFFPRNEELQNFVKALRDGPYPILVHCRQGADRTGLASAMYAWEYMGLEKEEAIDEQLSWRNWHVEAFHPAMKEFARFYQGTEWALHEYDLCGDPQSRKWAERCP